MRPGRPHPIRLATLVGLAWLAAPPGAAGQPVFRTAVDLVNFGVTVVDRQGKPVGDLRREDFEIVEAGTPQKIQYFACGDREGALPLRVGLLFDTSGSMEQDASFARSAAIKFLNTLPRAEDFTLVDFATEVRVARFSQADFPRLVERIRTRKPEGETALYDALGVYLDGTMGEEGQKVLVLFTDGGDTSSTMTFGEALDLLRASDITLYVVGFLAHQSPSVREPQRLRTLQLAEATGGQAFFPPSIKHLDESYGRILEELGVRCTLGYQSTNRRADGAWREVSIRIVRPDLRGAKVRTRKGYYAPYREGGR